MKNFVIRAVVGLVYAALLIGGLLMGPVTAFLFFELVTMATIMEFCRVLNRHAGGHVLGLLTATAGFLLVAFSWMWCLEGVGSQTAIRWLALYGLLLLAMPIGGLYRRKSNPMHDWMAMMAAQIYVALPFALLPVLAHAARDSYGYSWQLPLAVFIFIWVNDTGAYLVGSLLHRQFPWKLFPSISPKKSWVGSIGGGIATLLASVGCWHWIPSGYSLPVWLGFALVVVVFGTWGDLVESQLKRQLGIKDSGHILPGHGGMLDRFDSSLLAIPASVIYFTLLP